MSRKIYDADGLKMSWPQVIFTWIYMSAFIAWVFVWLVNPVLGLDVEGVYNPHCGEALISLKEIEKELLK